MIIIDVRRLLVDSKIRGLEQDHYIYLVEVRSDRMPVEASMWREETADPEFVRAFIRGVKAGNGLRDVVHVEQPEWNV